MVSYLIIPRINGIYECIDRPVVTFDEHFMGVNNKYVFNLFRNVTNIANSCRASFNTNYDPNGFLNGDDRSLRKIMYKFNIFITINNVKKHVYGSLILLQNGAADYVDLYINNPNYVRTFADTSTVPNLLRIGDNNIFVAYDCDERSLIVSLNGIRTLTLISDDLASITELIVEFNTMNVYIPLTVSVRNYEINYEVLPLIDISRKVLRGLDKTFETTNVFRGQPLPPGFIHFR